MPYLAYEGMNNVFFVLATFALAAVVPILISVVALSIGWGGRRAGVVVGGIGLAISIAGLIALLATAPHLWWVSVIPIALCVAAIRLWYHHAGPATARRLRFDLRALFALVLCVGLILGGKMAQQRQTQVEAAAAATIEALPLGAGNIIVTRHLERVTEVTFLTPLSPEEFERAADAMEQFSQLYRLQLNDYKLSPTITKRLGLLTTLRNLIIQNTPVTDDDLRPLANLTNLEYLDLNAKQLTDAGLVHLSGLKRLRTLHLYDPDKISPAAMKKFRTSLPLLDHP